MVTAVESVGAGDSDGLGRRTALAILHVNDGGARADEAQGQGVLALGIGQRALVRALAQVRVAHRPPVSVHHRAAEHREVGIERVGGGGVEQHARGAWAAVGGTLWPS